MSCISKQNTRIDNALLSLMHHQPTGGSLVKRYGNESSFFYDNDEQDASSCSTQSLSSSTEKSSDEWAMSSRRKHHSRPSLELTIVDFCDKEPSIVEEEPQLLTRPKHHKKQNNSILSIPSLHDSLEDDSSYSSDEDDDDDSIQEFARDTETQEQNPSNDDECKMENCSDLTELTLMQFIRGQRLLREQRLQKQQEAQSLLPCLKTVSSFKPSKKSVRFAYNPDAQCVWSFVNKPPASWTREQQRENNWYSRQELLRIRESQVLQRQVFEPIYNQALTEAFEEAREGGVPNTSSSSNFILCAMHDHFSSPSLYYNHLRGMEVDCCGLLADSMEQHERSIMKLCDVQWEGTTLFESSGSNKNDVADAALLRLQSLKVSRSSARLAQALAAWDRQEANVVYSEEHELW